MDFGAIPAEMKFYRQWIVWRLEDHGGPKPTKVPYSPNVLGAKASVDKPGTWGTFEDAVRAYESGGFSGIGFVLTEGDPYLFIDLDDTKGDEEAFNRQQRIFSEFPSYAERSPSGTGLHIICKASVPRGRKHANIEIYSSLRYMTMTGDVYRDAPIIECQDAATLLWHQMGGASSIRQTGFNTEQREDDETVKGRALSAINGDKFKALFEGDWENLYSSQSEADFALYDIIGFYSQNEEQCTRIFRSSKLGERDKAKRNDYCTFMFQKAMDRQLPGVEWDAVKMQLEEVVQGANQGFLPGMGIEKGAPEGPGAPYTIEPGRSTPCETGVAQGPLPVNGNEIVLPPGLLGEVAQYILDAAPRPVPAIALVGAIGFLAGLVGKAYNVSNTGLNMYVLCLAPTGTGKEAINSGISKLVSAVNVNCPPIMDFVGPGEARSDAALIKWLSRQPCVWSVQGEWGMRLKQMASPYANSNEIGVKKVIMDLFNKSGHGDILNPMAYSDKEKNTPPIPAPAFTMIGESTPEKFYEVLDESLISDGFLPRFLTIEYNGQRPALSKTASLTKPSFALLDMVSELVVHVKHIMGQNGVINVQQDAYAEKLLDDFEEFTTANINDMQANEVVRHMWNRAHIKALKLSALVAVGVNPYNPIIDLDCARWACDLVSRDVTKVIDRFVKGEIGSAAMGAGEQKQIDEMVRVIGIWLQDTTGVDAGKYGTPGNMHAAGVVLFKSINRRLMAMAAFRNDKIGATNAIKRTLQHLIDADDLREVPRKQMIDMFGVQAKAYVMGNPYTFSRKS